MLNYSIVLDLYQNNSKAYPHQDIQNQLPMSVVGVTKIGSFSLRKMVFHRVSKGPWGMGDLLKIILIISLT
jgi:hypothetical protein